MKIDIWSDIVCPFCVIGKRHLELALENFEHADDVEIVWHSYELDPSIEREPGRTLVDTIATKYGISAEQSAASQRDVAARAAAVGLTFNWQDAKYGNTFDAHRLIHLAAHHGLATAAETRLMHAYFTEGVSIGDVDELQRLGEEIGLPADDVRRVLAGDEFTQDVRADEAAARQIGITGVPFFVLDGRLAVSGAQPVDTFERALTQAWQARTATSDPTLDAAATHGASTSSDDADPDDVEPTGPDADSADHGRAGTHSHPGTCDTDHCAI